MRLQAQRLYAAFRAPWQILLCNQRRKYGRQNRFREYRSSRFWLQLSRTVTAANLTGRKSILAKLRADGQRLMHLQPEAGFRESFRIQGETVITANDYRSGRLFDDAVCYAFYPVDLHTKKGVKPEPLKPGTVPTVPLRALIPKGSRNLMVAGRCVSSDRLANSGLRVQASCMGIGQAAGAAAALAAKAGATPLEVPLKEIHDLLRTHGAIIPGDA